MKTIPKQWWLAGVSLTLAVAVLADNPCIENPTTNYLSCVPGTLAAGYGLVPTNITVTVGQFIPQPTVFNLAITNGWQTAWVDYICTPSQTGPVTNPIAYTFGGPYFVPDFPNVLWTPGIHTYTGWVPAYGSACGPVTNTLGSVTVTVSSNNPDVLINVDFGGRPTSAKAGYAAVGNSGADGWNEYAQTNLAAGSLAGLRTAEGVVSPVGLLATNLPTLGTAGSSDAMYQDFLFTNGATATLTFTNLPDGAWQVYLYATNGNFSLSVGTVSYGNQTCSDPAPAGSPVWQPGVQYVAFNNVVISNSQPLTVTVSPGPSGEAMISGLQIASAAHIPWLDAAQPARLVARWKAENNAYDLISGSNGVVYPGTTFAAGQVGQGFSFDGVSGRILNTNTPSLTNVQNNFTLEFWARPQKGINLLSEGGGGGASGQSYAIFPDSGGGDGKAGVGVSVGTNGICVVEHADNYMPSMLTYACSLNDWVHVAVVYTNKRPVLYLNGTNFRTGITSGRAFVYPCKNFGNALGDSGWISYGPYQGLLDEVGIYNRVLSPAEIISLYQAGLNGNLSPSTDSDYDGVSDRQELADRTNPNDAQSGRAVRLGYWPFDNTNTWVGSAGQLPLVATNLVGVPSWSTNAVLMDSTNPVVLTYRDVETNGNANINLRQGTVRFWFKPGWSSTRAGGNGPGTDARLIELGSYNYAFTNGWWALYFSPDGDSLSFGTVTNGAGMANLTATTIWNSNVWHQIALTYTPTASILYVDGQVATTGPGVIYYPQATERANGFRLGSDASGSRQAKGTFDELQTFNFPLNPGQIGSDFNNDQVALISRTVSGMRLWLRADAGITSPGGGIGNWADQSGQGNHATQGTDYNQPRYVTNAVNGLPAVWFSGTNSSGWTNSYFNLPDNLLNGATGAEAFVVLKAASAHPTARQSLWEMGGNPLGSKSFPDTDGSLMDDFGSATVHQLGTPAQPLNEFNIYGVSSQTNDWSAWVNGILLHHANVNTVQFPTNAVWPTFGKYTLGGSSYYSGSAGMPNYFAGEIAEVLVFNHALVASDRSLLNDYLKRKYGFVPVVTMTAPANNAVFPTGSNIQLSADAFELGGGTIKQVEFFQGATSLGIVTTAPYSLTWNEVAAGSGTTNLYTLTARVTGNNGLVSTSAVVNILVAPPPTVALTNPTDGAYFGIEPVNINLAATASDITGIKQVQFFQGANSLGTVTTAPYQMAWNHVMAVSCPLTAVATGNDGLSTTSSVVNIIVDADVDLDGLGDWAESRYGTDPNAAEGFWIRIATPNQPTALP